MPGDLRGAFRPTECPSCRKATLNYQDDLGTATCPSCKSMWLTEVKPSTDYRALTYQIAEGGIAQ